MIAVDVADGSCGEGIEVDGRLSLVRGDGEGAVAFAEENAWREARDPDRDVRKFVAVEIATGRAGHLITDVIGVGGLQGATSVSEKQGDTPGGDHGVIDVAVSVEIANRQIVGKRTHWKFGSSLVGEITETQKNADAVV